MPASPDTRLRLAPQRQSWRIWDGAVVTFEPLSGDTHRIQPPAGHILGHLTRAADSRSAITAAIGPAATPEQIDEALDLLLAMELVESA